MSEMNLHFKTITEIAGLIESKHLSEPLLCQVGAAYEGATEWHNMHPNL